MYIYIYIYIFMYLQAHIFTYIPSKYTQLILPYILHWWIYYKHHQNTIFTPILNTQKIPSQGNGNIWTYTNIAPIPRSCTPNWKILRSNYRQQYTFINDTKKRLIKKYYLCDVQHPRIVWKIWKISGEMGDIINTLIIWIITMMKST